MISGRGVAGENEPRTKECTKGLIYIIYVHSLVHGPGFTLYCTQRCLLSTRLLQNPSHLALQSVHGRGGGLRPTPWSLATSPFSYLPQNTAFNHPQTAPQRSPLSSSGSNIDGYIFSPELVSPRHNPLDKHTDRLPKSPLTCRPSPAKRLPRGPDDSLQQRDRLRHYSQCLARARSPVLKKRSATTEDKAMLNEMILIMVGSNSLSSPSSPL